MNNPIMAVCCDPMLQLVAWQQQALFKAVEEGIKNMSLEPVKVKKNSRDTPRTFWVVQDEKPFEYKIQINTSDYEGDGANKRIKGGLEMSFPSGTKRRYVRHKPQDGIWSFGLRRARQLHEMLYRELHNPSKEVRIAEPPLPRKNPSQELIQTYYPYVLHTLIPKEEFSDEHRLNTIIGIFSTVEALHKRGYIHRDIKPDNILLDQDFTCYLNDFDLCTARIISGANKRYSYWDSATNHGLSNPFADVVGATVVLVQLFFDSRITEFELLQDTSHTFFKDPKRMKKRLKPQKRGPLAQKVFKLVQQVFKKEEVVFQRLLASARKFFSSTYNDVTEWSLERLKASELAGLGIDRTTIDDVVTVLTDAGAAETDLQKAVATFMQDVDPAKRSAVKRIGYEHKEASRILREEHADYGLDASDELFKKLYSEDETERKGAFIMIDQMMEPSLATIISTLKELRSKALKERHDIA